MTAPIHVPIFHPAYSTFPHPGKKDNIVKNITRSFRKPNRHNRHTGMLLLKMKEIEIEKYKITKTEEPSS